MAPRDAFSPYAVTISACRFYVYANDHPPPHAHVRLQRTDCMVTIDLRTGDPLRDDLPRAVEREWIQLRPMVLAHLPKMLAEFERLNPHREERR